MWSRRLLPSNRFVGITKLGPLKGEFNSFPSINKDVKPVLLIAVPFLLKFTAVQVCFTGEKPCFIAMHQALQPMAVIHVHVWVSTYFDAASSRNGPSPCFSSLSATPPSSPRWFPWTFCSRSMVFLGAIPWNETQVNPLHLWIKFFPAGFPSLNNAVIYII